MVGVDGRGRVDLETVVVLASILKKAVHGVQNFVGQQEEPFPAEQQDTSGHAKYKQSALNATITKIGLSFNFIAIYNLVRQTKKYNNVSIIMKRDISYNKYSQNNHFMYN